MQTIGEAPYRDGLNKFFGQIGPIQDLLSSRDGLIEKVRQYGATHERHRTVCKELLEGHEGWAEQFRVFERIQHETDVALQEVRIKLQQARHGVAGEAEIMDVVQEKIVRLEGDIEGQQARLMELDAQAAHHQEQIDVLDAQLSALGGDVDDLQLSRTIIGITKRSVGRALSEGTQLKDAEVLAVAPDFFKRWRQSIKPVVGRSAASAALIAIEASTKEFEKAMEGTQRRAPDGSPRKTSITDGDVVEKMRTAGTPKKPCSARRRLLYSDGVISGVMRHHGNHSEVLVCD